MLMACLPSERPQSAMPFRSTFGRSSLPKKGKLHLIARSVPKKGASKGWFQQGLNFLYSLPSRQGPIPRSDPRPFYKRVAEEAEFRDLFNGIPSEITVFFGPIDTGKTIFLTRLLDALEMEENAPPLLYINSSLFRPEDLPSALCGQIQSKDFVNWLKHSSPDVRSMLERNLHGTSLSAAVKWPWPVRNLSAALPKIFAQDYEHYQDYENLDKTLKKLWDLFTALKPLPKKPVFVIDPAHLLTEWNNTDMSQRALKELLMFLVAISKDLVHVVLVTSDSFFPRWLVEKGLDRESFKVKVLGELPEHEARDFFFGDAEGTWLGLINDPYYSRRQVPDGADAHWSEIYEMCGGNMYLPLTCVENARSKGDWTSAVKGVIDRFGEEVEKGLDPEYHLRERDVPPLWTPDQYKLVLQRITSAPHHAVVLSKLAKDLEKQPGWQGNISGYDIIMSMARYQRVIIRPPSTLARDLPQEVYGEPQEEVVTLDSSPDIVAAKALLKESDT